MCILMLIKMSGGHDHGVVFAVFQIQCVLFHRHSPLLLTVITCGRFKSVSQATFQPLKDLSQKYPVSPGQELKFAALF